MSARDAPTASNPALFENTEELLSNRIEEQLQTDEEDLKKYLGDALIPLLAYGLDELERTRPPDPIQFLSHFLLRHNPRKSYV